MYRTKDLKTTIQNKQKISSFYIGADFVDGVSALFFQQSYKFAYSNLLLKAVAVTLLYTVL